MFESSETNTDGKQQRRSAQSRYDLGLATLEAVGGTDYDRIVRPLLRLSADFHRLLIEHGYGEVVGRPGLSLQTRELVTVGVLCVMGNAPSALKFHCAGMLNTGWTPPQLVETMIHASAYGGFQAAFHGIQLVRDVLREQSIDYQPDESDPVSMTGTIDAAMDLLASFDARSGSDICPDLDRLAIEFVDNELWTRPGLAPKDRHIATLGMIFARGNQADAVRRHLKACIRSGWTRAELTEVLIQMTGYIGWPQTLALVGPALEVFEQCEEHASPKDAGIQDKAADACQPAVEQGTCNDKWPRAWESRASPPEQTFLSEIAPIAPDLARYYDGVATRGVFMRQDLDIKTQELATVAALAMSGRVIDAEPFRQHAKAALNAGAKQGEIIEAVLQLLPYAGFVATRQAMDQLSEVFRECPGGLSGQHRARMEALR